MRTTQRKCAYALYRVEGVRGSGWGVKYMRTSGCGRLTIGESSNDKVLVGLVRPGVSATWCQLVNSAGCVKKVLVTEPFGFWKLMKFF